MKNLKRALLLGVVVCGAAFIANGFSASSSRNNVILDNNKFLSAPPVVGQEIDSAKKQLGTPESKESKGCALPVKDGEGMKPLVGERWDYTYRTDRLAAELHLCVIGGYVVGEMREISMLDAHGILSIRHDEFAALELAKKLYVESQKSDGKSHQAPLSTEPELEI